MEIRRLSNRELSTLSGEGQSSLGFVLVFEDGHELRFGWGDATPMPAAFLRAQKAREEATVRATAQAEAEAAEAARLRRKASLALAAKEHQEVAARKCAEISNRLLRKEAAETKKSELSPSSGKFQVPKGVARPSVREALAALQAARISCLPERALRELYRLKGQQARKAEAALERIVRSSKRARERGNALWAQQRASRQAARRGPQPGSGIKSLSRRRTA